MRRSSIGGLLITRTQGQIVRINHGELDIEVVAIRGKYVRLAFRASKEIHIDRLPANSSCNTASNEEPCNEKEV